MMDTGFFLIFDEDDGRVDLQVVASDLAGNKAIIELSVYIDPTPPWILLEELPENGITRRQDLTLVGNVEDMGPTRVLVNGWRVDLIGSRFQYEHPLEEGWNDICIEVVDAAGNSRSQSFQVLRDLHVLLEPPLRIGRAIHAD